MPLPLAERPSDIPTNVCCDTTWLIGERIREVAFAAVCSCIDASCQSNPMRSWQTEGSQSGSIKGDSLVVSYIRSTLATVSRSRTGASTPLVVTRAEFRVELRENGWPMIREESSVQGVKLPDPQVVHALARHARSHAEKMWRALNAGASATSPALQLFPASTNPHILNRGVAIGDLVARGPSGPQVTYDITVTVDHTLP